MIAADHLTRIWANRWPRPDPETNRHHRRMVRGFGEDFAGEDPGGISAEDARSWALENPGKVRYVRSMLNDALDDGLIDVNVFANMRLPVPEEEEIVVPTDLQIAQLEHAATPEILDAIIVAKRTGLRQGELRALAIEDVPAAVANRIDVEWQITRDGRLKRPKKGSTGRILLPEDAAHVINVRRHIATADTRVRPHRFFPLSRDQLNRQWKQTRINAGVWIRWHDFRHYCGTWLWNNGASADDIAEQLRCDVDLVRKRYCHPDVEESLGRLERAIAPR